MAGATEDGICLLEFSGRRRVDDQVATLRARLETEVVRGDNDHLARLRGELRAYFDGALTTFTGPLVVRGTPFEERVWAALCRIPYGATLSYGDLARAIGESAAASRAVGRANGRNRIAILIPCHRVIGKDRTLVGYGGGLWRKKRLLDFEHRQRPLF